MPASAVVAGRRVGVVVAESVLGGGCAGRFDLDGRDGLISGWLFFRDRLPAFADDALEVFVLARGLVGEGSRDGSGDGAADEAAEVCDVWVV